ncbi:MAG: carboxypeptidase regulatory-like domain-containing protein [Acidobacteria bacterium]|nr:carboxypeptidase regulatory-like domain-containing protein [Acidobacteriota bacterium]MCL5287202.1 carboxypeptidase regulatory-like domain-containing protein [Acidobacteriota bacterium]
MRILVKLMARMLPLAVCAFLLAGPVAAQFAVVEGEVRDLQGKPFPDAAIILKHDDSGQTLETKTDKNGQFVMNGMRIGIWSLTVKVKGTVAHERKIQVSLSGTERVVINFKDLVAKMSEEEAAARKKQEEERTKFQGMKAHFDAGRTSLDQAIATRNELQRTPVADRGPLTEKLTQASTTAITELEAAQQSAPPNDANLHIVMSNLGQAYEVAGRYDDAVAAFSKAIELKPEMTNYYLGMGTAQAKAGKVTEAMATCDKASTLPSAAAASAAESGQATASCYANVGITLQNAAKMKESVEPFRKATAVNPNSPDYWFWLARALVAAMEYKTEGTLTKIIIQPGTAEAYQKYLELAPSGRYAQEAKDGLAMLESIAPGIQTKITTKKKKK